jgi:hypothetical protein
MLKVIFNQCPDVASYASSFRFLAAPRSPLYGAQNERIASAHPPLGHPIVLRLSEVFWPLDAKLLSAIPLWGPLLVRNRGVWRP